MTQKGRVVYDRKKNVFRPSEIARILDSYSAGMSGRDFGEFLWGVLKLAVDRRARPRGWERGVYWVLWFRSGIGTDPEEIEKDIEKMQEFFGGTPQIGPQKDIVPPTPETQAERKRRLARR